MSGFLFFSKPCKSCYLGKEQLIVCSFFFFQAEDGIRDYKVTGVQTCALPIWGWLAGVVGVETAPIDAWVPMMLFTILFGLSMDYEIFLLSSIREDYLRTGDKIGRASCRERV